MSPNVNFTSHRRREGLDDSEAVEQTLDHIAKDLEHLGVRAGGVLLVHSSLSSMGYVLGGAQTVIKALRRALGPDGTLLMPALSYEHVTSKNPVFDVRRTPSNVGVIPETFRRQRSTLRSVHPTHSVCGVGAQAEALLADHHRDTTPCGPNSPFRKLPTVGGQILMLGCGLRPNTSIHAIEELVVPPYLFGPPMTYSIIGHDGTIQDRVYTPHNFQGYVQRYDRVARILKPPALIQGQVLEADAFLVEASELWKVARSVLEQNPLAFVERTGPTPS
ncbi:MAG: AAC(3) family N-acetyltransferase [Anaerolineae bacterium]